MEVGPLWAGAREAFFFACFVFSFVSEVFVLLNVFHERLVVGVFFCRALRLKTQEIDEKIVVA